MMDNGKCTGLDAQHLNKVLKASLVMGSRSNYNNLVLELDLGDAASNGYLVGSFYIYTLVY